MGTPSLATVGGFNDSPVSAPLNWSSIGDVTDYEFDSRVVAFPRRCPELATNLSAKLLVATCHDTMLRTWTMIGRSAVHPSDCWWCLQLQRSKRWTRVHVERRRGDVFVMHGVYKGSHAREDNEDGRFFSSLPSLPSSLFLRLLLFEWS